MIKKTILPMFLVVFSFIAMHAQQQTSNKLHDFDTLRHWRWEQMTPADLAEAIKTLPVVYLVVSPLEWHGEAISFGCDPLVGTTVAEQAWKKTGGVIIPTLYVGVETLYHGWSESDFKMTDYWGMELIPKNTIPAHCIVLLLHWNY